VSGAGPWLVLLAAGVLGGVVGSAGGITTLVTYPALLAVGLPPLAANVTNSVALLGSGVSSSLRAGPDVDGHSRTLRVWTPPMVVVSLLGAVLLVSTPSATFDAVVPFLVALGAAILLAQPAIDRWQVRRGTQPHRLAVAAAGAGVAAYNGYFGAGSGILLIALLMLTTERVLHRANSLKNVILLASDVLPAVLFALVGGVVWSAVWPLGIGAVLGGLVGPTVARRAPAGVMRVLIAACGFALAGWLLLHR
jgi:uncharacterized membrane protein YfcA